MTGIKRLEVGRYLLRIKTVIQILSFGPLVELPRRYSLVQSIHISLRRPIILNKYKQYKWGIRKKSTRATQIFDPKMTLNHLEIALVSVPSQIFSIHSRTEAHRNLCQLSFSGVPAG